MNHVIRVDVRKIAHKKYLELSIENTPKRKDSKDYANAIPHFEGNQRATDAEGGSLLSR
jgi:hypothetical protein